MRLSNLESNFAYCCSIPCILFKDEIWLVTISFYILQACMNCAGAYHIIVIIIAAGSPHRHRGFPLAQFQVSSPSLGCHGLALLSVRQCWPGAEPSQGAWYGHRWNRTRKGHEQNSGKQTKPCMKKWTLVLFGNLFCVHFMQVEWRGTKYNL